MHLLTDIDLEFKRQFEAGELAPGDFNHRAHLRLGYIHLASHGPDQAVTSFRNALLAYLGHHGVDPGKFHETMTQAWLMAVWHFMQRAGDTSGSEDFLLRSTELLDPKVMLTHYSRELLSSEDARKAFVKPDLEPIPPGD
jgi:hypothetical protein